jgi:membrane-associated phospholipid phosphatase
MPSPLLANLLRVVCIVAIATVGIARMYDKTHFPTDVAAGYLLALLYLIPALFFYRRLAGHRAG